MLCGEKSTVPPGKALGGNCTFDFLDNPLKRYHMQLDRQTKRWHVNCNPKTLPYRKLPFTVHIILVCLFLARWNPLSPGDLLTQPFGSLLQSSHEELHLILTHLVEQAVGCKRFCLRKAFGRYVEVVEGGSLCFLRFGTGSALDLKLAKKHNLEHLPTSLTFKQRKRAYLCAAVYLLLKLIKKTCVFTLLYTNCGCIVWLVIVWPCFKMSVLSQDIPWKTSNPQRLAIDVQTHETHLKRQRFTSIAMQQWPRYRPTATMAAMTTPTTTPTPTPTPPPSPPTTTSPSTTSTTTIITTTTTASQSGWWRW